MSVPNRVAARRTCAIAIAAVVAVAAAGCTSQEPAPVGITSRAPASGTSDPTTTSSQQQVPEVALGPLVRADQRILNENVIPVAQIVRRAGACTERLDRTPRAPSGSVVVYLPCSDAEPGVVEPARQLTPIPSRQGLLSQVLAGPTQAEAAAGFDDLGGEDYPAAFLLIDDVLVIDFLVAPPAAFLDSAGPIQSIVATMGVATGASGVSILLQHGPRCARDRECG